MNKPVFDTWFRTALIPTSLSACISVIAGSILFAYPFLGSLEALALTFTWAIWGVPLTFLCGSLASVFLLRSAASAQLRTGLIIAVVAPVLFLGAITFIHS